MQGGRPQRCAGGKEGSGYTKHPLNDRLKNYYGKQSAERGLHQLYTRLHFGHRGTLYTWFKQTSRHSGPGMCIQALVPKVASNCAFDIPFLFWLFSKFKLNKCILLFLKYFFLGIKKKGGDHYTLALFLLMEKVPRVGEGGREGGKGGKGEGNGREERKKMGEKRQRKEGGKEIKEENRKGNEKKKKRRKRSKEMSIGNGLQKE